ncbi:hypothetical protein ACWD01_17515 [Streptomyces sp. NPDC002835]
MADLQDLMHTATASCAVSRGLKALCLPLTIRTITCRPTWAATPSRSRAMALAET